ncbi:MAG: hypothetical protein ACO2OT_07590 [Candidatus Caldipriscus sp.]
MKTKSCALVLKSKETEEGKLVILGALVGGIIRSLQVFGILASSYFSNFFGKVLSLELSPAVVGGFYLGGH